MVLSAWFGHQQRRETALDVVAYAAQIAAQLGANIVKVKLPSSHLEQPEAKKAYETNHVPLEKLADRVRHVVQSCFDGRRIVIFSGGPKVTDEKLIEEVRAIKAGGGFGSIIGRNSFQLATCRSDQVARLDHGHLRRLGLCALTTRLARGRLSRRISLVRGLAILGKRLPVIWEDPYK